MKRSIEVNVLAANAESGRRAAKHDATIDNSAVVEALVALGLEMAALRVTLEERLRPASGGEP